MVPYGSRAFLAIPLRGSQRTECSTEYRVPTADSGPIYITNGPDGALWFTEGNARQIGRVTTTGLFGEYDSGPLGGAPIAITTARDGVWFGKLGYVARINAR